MPPPALPVDYIIATALLPQVEAFMCSEEVVAKMQAIRVAATANGTAGALDVAACRLDDLVCHALATARIQRRQCTRGTRENNKQ